MKIKITANWYLSNENVADILEKAKESGFNAFAWNDESKETEFISLAKKYNIKTFKILEPLNFREDAVIQEVEPGEEKMTGFNSIDENYQYGGEPIPGVKEILNKILVCPRDPTVVDYTLDEVVKAKKAGYDGICWDFIGYRNYHSCCCKLCIEDLKEYMDGKSGLQVPISKQAFYEEGLIRLYSILYYKVKEIAPEMCIMSHCHPAYLPEPFYGLKTKVDYCGITVSWFFKPHWDFQKIKEYADKAINGPYRFKHTSGMPMIGFYGAGDMEMHRKSGEHLKKEIEIIKDANAEAIMICELGNLLECDDAANVVKEMLAI